MRLDEHVEMDHRDGVPWWSAPRPHRWHRCTAQTTGWVGFDRIERCACGGIRYPDRWQSWFERNTKKPKS